MEKLRNFECTFSCRNREYISIKSYQLSILIVLSKLRKKNEPRGFLFCTLVCIPPHERLHGEFFPLMERAYVSFRRSLTALQRETRNAREAANENDEQDDEAEEEEEEKRSEMKENAFALAREGRESGAGLIIRRTKEDLSDVRFPRGARFSPSFSLFLFCIPLHPCSPFRLPPSLGTCGCLLTTQYYYHKTHIRPRLPARARRAAMGVYHGRARETR